MRRFSLVYSLFMFYVLATVGCAFLVKHPLEKTSYNTIVSARAFLQSEYAAHPECLASEIAAQNKPLCLDLARAVAAKDSLIDITEVYCGGKSFDNGFPCQPPVKGSPGYDQAVAKLKAALANYNQLQTDIKGAAKP